jgi:hypothetical protein
MRLGDHKKKLVTSHFFPLKSGQSIFFRVKTL